MDSWWLSLHGQDLQKNKSNTTPGCKKSSNSTLSWGGIGSWWLRGWVGVRVGWGDGDGGEGVSLVFRDVALRGYLCSSRWIYSCAHSRQSTKWTQWLNKRGYEICRGLWCGDAEETGREGVLMDIIKTHHKHLWNQAIKIGNSQSLEE